VPGEQAEPIVEQIETSKSAREMISIEDVKQGGLTKREHKRGDS